MLKGPARDEDAIERADRMISRLRPDAAIERISRERIGTSGHGLVVTPDAALMARIGEERPWPVVGHWDSVDEWRSSAGEPSLKLVNITQRL